MNSCWLFYLKYYDSQNIPNINQLPILSLQTILVYCGVIIHYYKSHVHIPQLNYRLRIPVFNPYSSNSLWI